jgi:hypothetical protein
MSKKEMGIVKSEQAKGLTLERKNKKTKKNKIMAMIMMMMLYARPDQTVARGQHFARDTVLLCPRRHLKRENVF